MKNVLCFVFVTVVLILGLAPVGGAAEHDHLEGMDMYFDGNTTTGDFPGTLQCVKGDAGSGCRVGHAVLVTPLGPVSLIVPKSAAAAVKANLGKKVVVNGMLYTDIDTLFVANVEAK